MKIVNEQFPQDLEASYATIFSKCPFPLSDFQKWAIYSAHNKFDTLVCAPTGSGKTLPADFIIEHTVGRGKKVIYTTPIKALSNDKLAELSEKFPDVHVLMVGRGVSVMPNDVLKKSKSLKWLK